MMYRGSCWPWLLTVTAAFCVTLPIISAQLAEKLTAQNPCVAKATCSECIQTKSCAWCYQADFGDRARCYQPSYQPLSAPGGCKEEFTWDPSNEQRILLQKHLSKAESNAQSGFGGWGEGGGSGSSSGHGEIVQISPQRVQMKLRINQAERLQIYYAQAEDYPVDLYYLMDLSKSMEDDKEKLSALGDLLSEAMRNITSNFRLGFGSFVDKVVMPYVSTVPKNLQEPCEACAAPYGYHNVMALNQDTSRFAEEVRRAAVSGNLDAPEGGFDAIMQAVVCRHHIGWREKARRLLVFSTDAGFHYAGDGKLGGIVTPNDGECHLNSAGMYTHSSVQDYPSISQLNLKVKQNSINVIFAVTQQQIGVYDKLRGHVEGSSSATLSEDSSNVVDLVKDQYSKITSSVEMKDNATSAVKIAYFSQCLGSGNEEAKSKCDGLMRVGEVVKFTAEIVVPQCPEDPAEWKQTFQIYPVGINESLIVDLEMLCDCPCERAGHKDYEDKSPKCGDSGTYMCGICTCDPLHFGRHCECSASDVNGEKDLALDCRPDNTSTVDCSGKGNCVCGVCECEKRSNGEQISGKYCECDNFSCDRQNGLLCSGPEQGECVCGKCECLPGWGDSACDCRSSNATCTPPGGGEICSGHGSCECGACKCDVEKDGRYSGRYCEKCPTCPGRCLEFKECVMCQMYQTGPLTEEQCGQCKFTPIGVEVVEADEEKDEHLCSYYDEDDCRFIYVYSNEDDKVVVRAQQERECPPKVFMLGIVLGVIAAIVLIGMALLLLWKLLTTIHDRREFARFEKERMMAKWDTGENPIYKQATSTFKNPTYAGK